MGQAKVRGSFEDRRAEAIAGGRLKSIKPVRISASPLIRNRKEQRRADGLREKMEHALRKLRKREEK